MFLMLLDELLVSGITVGDVGVIGVTTAQHFFGAFHIRIRSLL